MNSSVETIQAKHLNLALQVTLQVEYYDWPSALFFASNVVILFTET